MQQIVSYNGSLKERARNFRNNSTKAEILLWSGLKNKKLGICFVRQKMVGNYIVDFYCKEFKLAIEVDDMSHDLKYNYDENRTAFLNKLNIKVLRFTNKDVLNSLEGVVEEIRASIKNA